MNEIRIDPIGAAKSFLTPEPSDKWSVVADVILDEKYTPPLKRVERSFSHHPYPS